MVSDGRRRVDSDSDSDDRRERKRRKKEKKEKKKLKKERRRLSEDEVQERAPAREVEPAVVSGEPKSRRRDFFAALESVEASKPIVGTTHATGRQKEDDEAVKERDWECHKCGYKNFKECMTCAKCRALRRFEGRNQPYSYCQ